MTIPFPDWLAERDSLSWADADRLCHAWGAVRRLQEDEAGWQGLRFWLAQESQERLAQACGKPESERMAIAQLLGEAGALYHLPEGFLGFVAEMQAAHDDWKREVAQDG